jgi:hypothetical protein
MAPVGARKVYGIPPETPDILFESRMFPVSFSHSPHFSQLDVDCSQHDAFGGLLPGLVAGPSRRARAVVCGPVSEDKEVRPPKRARPRKPDDDGEAHLPKRIRARLSDDDDEGVRLVKRVKVQAREPETAPRVPVPADKRVCLHCSKRIHLELSSTS